MTDQQSQYLLAQAHAGRVDANWHEPTGLTEAEHGAITVTWARALLTRAYEAKGSYGLADMEQAAHEVSKAQWSKDVDPEFIDTLFNAIVNASDDPPPVDFLVSLYDNITTTTEKVSRGGAVTTNECLAWHHAKNAIWSVRRKKFMGMLISTSIVAHVIANNDGWTVNEVYESDRLEHVSCPLKFLDMAPVVNRDWRDRVWQYHESRLEANNNKRTATTPTDQPNQQQYETMKHEGNGTMGFTQKASSGGGNFESCPAGNHVAVLIAIIDLGTQQETFQGKTKPAHKIYLLWELPNEKNSKGENFVIGREFTFSLNEKAALRKMIENWRTKPLAEGEEFDITKVLGKACMLQVLSTEKNGKTFSEVKGVSSLPKGMAAPTPENEPYTFNIDDDDLADFPADEWLPWSYGSKLIDLAKQSPEWQAKATGKPSHARQPAMAGASVGGGDADEAPF